MKITDDMLPELPDPARSYADHSARAFSKQQMIDYALAALDAYRRTTPDREAIIDLILAKLDPMIRRGAIDEPYHSERNGLIMAWNVVASFKTAPNGDAK